MADMEPMGTWDMMWYASRVLLGLIVIVPVLYYVLRHWGRRLTVNRSMYGNMEVLDVLPLGGGKQLLLVKLGGQALLLSANKDQIAFIWEVPSDATLQEEQFPPQDRNLEGLKRWVDRWRKRGDGEDDDH